MTTNKKGARAKAPQSTTVLPNGQSCSAVDFLTVLCTLGPALTKIYKADGTVESYDDAASFLSKEVPVADIHTLSKRLTGL
jgi:hypothetical protein